MSTPGGDDLIGNANIRITADTDPAIRALGRLSRDADGRIRDIRGRFVSETTLMRLGLTNAAGGGDRFSVSLRGLANVAGRVGPILGRVGAGIGTIGAAAGTAAPLLAGIVTTLENIAPAGAAAVTGMLAVTQASAAIKLGMIGVEDAVTAAFDTSEKGAKQFDAALKNLAPNARAFAVEVRSLRPAFASMQQGVQNRLFTGFADELGRLSKQVLPTVRTNLNTTALTLNRMALGASGAARELAADGTLGKAMTGANQGLSNLRTIPGQVVTALGQLAASGAPAFDRLTSAARGAATSISDRLSAAFKSGALEKAVNAAIDLLADLGDVAGNVFKILGNVMGPVQQAGGGLIGTLKEISGAIADATSTKGFQDAIGALAQVMGTLARTVGPLLGQALAAIGPVFTALGPPVERLITNLGAALSPIIDALGPVLAAAADAIGILVDALSPLLPVVGDLIASLLPPLVPLLESIGDVFTNAAPVVQQLADALTTALAPVIAQLPAIIEPLATHLSEMSEQIFPVFSDLVVQLGPPLAQMGVALGQVLVAAGPLITAMSQLIIQFVSGLMPILTPLIGLIGDLAALFAGHLSNVLTRVVVPAISAITALLSGDFSGAWRNAKDIVSGAITTMNDLFQGLPGKLFAALASLAGKLRQRATEAGSALASMLSTKVSEAVNWVRGLPGRAGAALATLAGSLQSRASSAGSALVSAVRGKVGEAVTAVREMPGRAASALGNLGGRLASAGRDLIRGMINGVRDMAGALASAAKDVVGSAIDAAKSVLKIGSPSKVFAEIGRDTGRGLVIGLNGAQDSVDKAASQMAATAAAPFSALGTGIPGSDAGVAGSVAALGVGATRTAAAPGPTVIHQTLTFENRGVIGSRAELQNWLSGMLDDLRLQGRLPMGSTA